MHATQNYHQKVCCSGICLESISE